MDLEQLKKTWNNATEELDRAYNSTNDISDVCKSKTMGLKDKLVAKYRFLWIICAIWTVFCGFFFNHEVVMPIMAIVLILYFFILGILNYKIYDAFKKLNYSDLTVKDMLISITNINITRSRYKIVGYCMMIPVLIALLWNFYVIDIYMFRGGVIGGVIGLICGLYFDHKIEKHIREMKELLKYELDDDDDDDDE